MSKNKSQISTKKVVSQLNILVPVGKDINIVIVEK